MISGANTIDIMGDENKTYKITLFALKPNTNYLLTSFKNPSTGEFITYRTQLVFTSPDVLGTLELLSVVRENTSKLITLENPLDTPVTIKPEYFVTDNDNLTISPN